MEVRKGMSKKKAEIFYRRRLPYVEAVMTEVQRMYVVTPIIGPRRVFRDTTLEGYSIPENTTILVNLYSVNMNADLYPNPHEFKPERFLKDDVHRPDKNLVLFGKGKTVLRVHFSFLRFFNRRLFHQSICQRVIISA